jgi:hypothetical protein
MSGEWDSQPLVWQYKPEFPNYNCFDFAFESPWVALDVQMLICEKVVKKVDETEGPCGSRVFVVWREYYQRHKTVGGHIINLKARKNPPGYSIQCGFGDCESPGDVAELGRQWCPMMALPEAKQDFKRAVGEVQALLKPAACPGPHFYIDPSCENTIWEFENYAWPKQTDAEVTINEGKPPKKIDHAVDAIRYLVMHIMVLGMQYHLDEVYGTRLSNSSRETPYDTPVPMSEPETVFSLARGGDW